MTSTTRWLLASLFLAAVPAAAATVTRGPYLQTPTPTGMIVRWRTDVATDSRVAWGPAPGVRAGTADDPTPVTDHVVPVTDLAPDTVYYYAVGTTGGPLAGDDADHHFRTAPAPGTSRPMRFWTIGDAGFTGANLDAVRDAYAAFNGTSAADLFLLLGDNAYLFGTDAQYQAAVFDEHRAMLRTTPVWSTFGNHERFSSLDLTLTGPYFAMFSFPTGGEAGGVASGTEAYYAFDFGNVHFIVLDSEDYTPTSTSSPMLTWLEADLQTTTADWVIAVWHRPPYSRGLLHNSDVEANEVNMRRFVVPVLESYGVDLVLCGHSHSYERSFLIDGHYGLAATFADSHKVEPGDGDPLGDGAYRKASLGPAPHSGAVFAVNGSGSEVRPTTLDHPAMLVGLLELGSMVIDVDGDTLTARFLDAAAQVRDEFRIIKGSACPATPTPGCFPGATGRLSVKNHANDARDQWRWRWRDGLVDAAAIGAPGDQTDVAACVYDQAGALVGGAILHGAAEWSPIRNGIRYTDRGSTRHGFRRVTVKYGVGRKARVEVQARGTGIGGPSLPAVFPVRAQLVNLDSGACWESVFATAKRNDPARVTAVLR
jgi:Calcineurin-like phosphoesterase/Purple acid Phosphatase, N-terminal domain